MVYAPQTWPCQDECIDQVSYHGTVQLYGIIGFIGKCAVQWHRVTDRISARPSASSPSRRGVATAGTWCAHWTNTWGARRTRRGLLCRGLTPWPFLGVARSPRFRLSTLGARTGAPRRRSRRLLRSRRERLASGAPRRSGLRSRHSTSASQVRSLR